jgi:hypothetical protein
LSLADSPLLFEIDLATNLAPSRRTALLDPRGRTREYQIALHDPKTGDALGHFPSQVGIQALPSEVVILGDEALVFFEQATFAPSGTVRIVRQWRDYAEWYP